MSPWWLGDRIDEAPEDEPPAASREETRGPRPEESDGPARRRRSRDRAGQEKDEEPTRSRGRRAPETESASEESPMSPNSLDVLAREIASLSRGGRDSTDERKIAVFFDFENLALGVRDSKSKEKFEVQRVLERLLEKGKIIVKKAYADWERYSEYKRPFHEAAIELIDIPQKRYSGKNSADIKMVVDAMDLCYSKEHLDTFVMVSGDSDFSPLVSKLRENDKYVIGIGVKNSTSQLLTDNCDEFIYYEDLQRDLQRVPRLDHLEEKQADVFGLMTEAMLALYREDKDVLWASMVKQTMKRKRPSFAESYYGYASFSELLEDAEKKGVVRLERDKGSGNYRIAGFGARRK